MLGYKKTIYVTVVMSLTDLLKFKPGLLAAFQNQFVQFFTQS